MADWQRYVTITVNSNSSFTINNQLTFLLRNLILSNSASHRDDPNIIFLLQIETRRNIASMTNIPKPSHTILAWTVLYQTFLTHQGRSTMSMISCKLASFQGHILQRYYKCNYCLTFEVPLKNNPSQRYLGWINLHERSKFQWDWERELGLPHSIGVS